MNRFLNPNGSAGYAARLFCCSCALAAALACTAQAQTLRVRLTDFDFLRYPTISASLCVTDSSGNPVLIDSSSVTLSRNGLPLPFSLFCLPAGSTLSIMQVLDNSGSMIAAMTDVRAAAGILVDSMRASDEMALLAFSSDTRLLADFTQNRGTLKSALGMMFANGSTALYDALGEAAGRLAGRSGARVIILISDGNDNVSALTVDEAIALAKSNGVAVYAIGLGAVSAPEQALIRIATETGGRYFRGASPADLAGIYDELARHLFSGCCAIDFALPNCADSTPSLFRVEYRSGSDAATFDTLFTLPWRPDTFHLAVDAGGRLLPGQYRDVHFRLSPSLSPALPLAFDVEVRYDPGLLKMDPPYAVTIGTMSQGKNVATSLPAPGVARISASAFFPNPLFGSLFYIRFTTAAGDSSRKTPVTVSNIRTTQGCPNILIASPDTIEICQCVEQLLLSIDPPTAVIEGESYRLTIRIREGIVSKNFVTGGRITFDPNLLELLSLTTGDGDPLPWRLAAPGLILLEESWQRAQSADSILLFADWGVKRGREPIPSRIDLPEFRLWSDCCYDADPDFHAPLLLEGFCEKIAVAREGVTLHPVHPNPANPAAEISFDVNGKAGDGANRIRMTLFNSAGARVATIAEGEYAEGRYSIPLDLSGYPAGKYFVRLEWNGASKARGFVVVK